MGEVVVGEFLNPLIPIAAAGLGLLKRKYDQYHIGESQGTQTMSEHNATVIKGGGGIRGTASFHTGRRRAPRWARDFPKEKPRICRAETSTTTLTALINTQHANTATCSQVFHGNLDSFLLGLFEQTMNNSSGFNAEANLMAKVFIKSISVKSTYINRGNTECKMLIYCCTPKRDMQSGNNFDGVAGDPYSLWEKGLRTEDIANASDLPHVPFVTPFQSTLFTKFWKVKKVIKVHFGPGDTFGLSQTVHLNKVFTGYELGNQNFWHGLTNVCMPVIMGQPMAESADSTTVGWGAARVSSIQNRIGTAYVVDSRIPTSWHNTSRTLLTTQGVMMEENAPALVTGSID